MGIRRLIGNSKCLHIGLVGPELSPPAFRMPVSARLNTHGTSKARLLGPRDYMFRTDRDLLKAPRARVALVATPYILDLVRVSPGADFTSRHTAKR